MQTWTDSVQCDQSTKSVTYVNQRGLPSTVPKNKVSGIAFGVWAQKATRVKRKRIGINFRVMKERPGSNDEYK